MRQFTIRGDKGNKRRAVKIETREGSGRSRRPGDVGARFYAARVTGGIRSTRNMMVDQS